ncbi:MAG: ABC transporter ATP-binding protein [Clostridia bacterium]|nr:ABC transporter ATP-binding protein [Clostridia bacterium]
MSLSVCELSFSYHRAPVLSGVSFEAHEGELLAVLGPNGVGKTTLFRCILGEQKRYFGTIEIDGADRKRLSPREVAHRIAYIPQTHAAAFRYTVRDMVLMGTSHTLSPFASPGKKQEAAAAEAMEKLGITALSDRSFDALSGGEQQLVYIARALAQQTRTLLMDEPTSSLDYGNQIRVLNAVKTLSREGYSVLLSTHNPQHALWYADRVLALKDGRVAALGPAHETLTETLLEALYGTRVTLTDSQTGPVIRPVPNIE